MSTTSSTEDIGKYYAAFETKYKDKFEKSKNGLYWIQKSILTTEIYEDLRSLITPVIKKGKYVGGGTYGAVSMCQIQGTRKKCVMKVVKNDWNVDDIDAEVEVLDLAPRNNSFPKMFYCGYLENLGYAFIMEAVLGGTLHYHVNKRSPISFEAKKVILIHIARGLLFLHARLRTHGDLKLENIGLTAIGYVKLLDFGKSRKMTGKQIRQILPRGTITYEAPEIIQQKESWLYGDLWSFGIVTAILIQERYPFYHKDDEILANMIINDKPYINIINPYVKDFVRQLLRKDPDERLRNLLGHKFLEDVKGTPKFVPGDVLSNIYIETPLKTAEIRFYNC